LTVIGKPWPGFGPGTFALPRQRSTRLSYQGADILRHKLITGYILNESYQVGMQIVFNIPDGWWLVY
jgi:hypothetical protein